MAFVPARNIRCLASCLLTLLAALLLGPAGAVAAEPREVAAAILGVRSEVPPEARTAGTLGRLRIGTGVLIGADGLVLTIGYLITEAETIWLGHNSGKVVPAHLVAYDFETGFGLVPELAPIDAAPLPLGRTRDLPVGSQVIVAGAGGRRRALTAKLVGKREFAGY